MAETAAIDQRLVRGLAGTIDLTPADQEGEALELAGPVQVTVVDHLGITVLGPVAATETDGKYSTPITATLTASLALWTCSWVDDDSGSTWTTKVEVAGGHLFTVAQLLASDPTVEETDPADVVAMRLVVESEAEWICDVAFTPRLRGAFLDGTGEHTLRIPDHRVRRLVGVSIAGTNQTLGPSLTVDPDGTLWSATGWPYGRNNVAVLYEAGHDRPAPDLRDALLVRCRTLLRRPDSHVPLNAVQWQPEAGGSYRLATPSRYKTGIPDVDAVYFRYSERVSNDSDKPAPASGRFDLDPSRGSLFHRGRR